MTTSLLMRVLRVPLLVFLSVLGTSVLVYAAPGYFTDAGEMDAAHAAVTRTALDRMAQQQHSMDALLCSELHDWSHGDLGHSRQFGTPVAALIRERTGRSVRLLVSGVALGWILALVIAIPFSACRGRLTALGVAASTSLLLALPAGVLAVLCLLGNVGGPVLVLAVVIAARDLKIIEKLLKGLWGAPFVLHARASGLTSAQLLRTHILPCARGEVIALAVMSFALALSALVPVEVLFDTPGLGQLAWSAAMNRDLPVLTAVTALMSAGVGLAGCFAGRDGLLENASCA